MHSRAHRTLGLDCPCTKEQLKVAYRRMALETHPDKGGTNSAFVAVHEAHQAILDRDQWAMDAAHRAKDPVEELMMSDKWSRVWEWQEAEREDVNIESEEWYTYP